MSRVRKTKLVVNSLKELGWPGHIIASFTPEVSERIIQANIPVMEKRITKEYIIDYLEHVEEILLLEASDKAEEAREGADVAPSNGENNDHDSI